MPTPQKWYKIQNKVNAEAKSAEVFIYGDIGESWWGDSVTAADFVKEVSALDVDELTVRINSYGGSVTDGIAIYNAIKRHKAKVIIGIDGIAASIASLIAMAGDTVEMAENALMMIHAPWGGIAGNAVEMRKYADMLDTWAEAMASSYSNKSGKDKADVLALLTDGEDHWLTAEECQAEGYVDNITSALALAASLDTAAIAARFNSVPAALASSKPAAAAAQPTKEKAMPVKDKLDTAAPDNQPAAKYEEEIRAAALKADGERRDNIAASFGKFKAQEGVPELLATCQSDINCTVEDANKRLLVHLGKGATPIAGDYVVTVKDEADKQHDAIVQAIMARAAVPGIKMDAANPYRGMKLLDVARESLVRAGINVRAMDQMKIVGAAFTQSTSDFPVLLENIMHKTLQTVYATAPDTWSRFCSIGSVSDFRAHNRYRVGSLGNLADINELGEYENRTIPDGEKSTAQAGTKGFIINISRQTIINDDLGAFVNLAMHAGRAAKRTIEADVYALLLENAGLGPTLADGKTLIHADHGNISGSAGAPSVAAFDAMRVAMASQTDVGGNDYLDLRPSIWLGPISLGGEARVINDSEYDPDANNKLQRANKVRGLIRDVVDTPRLTGTAHYMFADPNEAPVVEVSFLDGNQVPYIELQNGFDVDGARWKVRLDYGVDAIDYRGIVRNAGA